MPVIGIPIELLNQQIKTTLDADEMVLTLQRLGCDVEGFATLRRFGCQSCGMQMEVTETEEAPASCSACGKDFRAFPELCVEDGESEVIRMELLAVRPDMFDPGGLARVLRHYFREDHQPAHYPITQSGWRVEIDPKVREKKSFRPYISTAIIRGVSLDSETIKVIMKLQENLHWALGRDRKRASIGVYDLSTLKGSTITYTVASPQDRFVPLGMEQEMTLEKILQDHPKGYHYAHLLEDFSHYPLLKDSEGQVLSMPPIINSQETRVTLESQDLFVDVTGLDQRLVDKTLHTIVTSILELHPQAKLESTEVLEPDETVRVTPDLTPQRVTFDPKSFTRWIGVEADDEKVKELLCAMGHAVHQKEDHFIVEVPAYRNDILHPRDLVEDAAIAYGYHHIETQMVETMTVGGALPTSELSNAIRETACGLGLYEVLTLLLSNETDQFEKLDLEVQEDRVIIDNPISREQTMLRYHLWHGLLDTLSANTDQPLPQGIFEVGHVGRTLSEGEVPSQEPQYFSVAGIGSRVDYSWIASQTLAILKDLDLKVQVQAVDSPLMIPGRSAQLMVELKGEWVCVGVMGEVHPRVLERYRLGYPTAISQVSLDAIRSSRESW